MVKSCPRILQNRKAVRVGLARRPTGLVACRWIVDSCTMQSGLLHCEVSSGQTGDVKVSDRGQMASRPRHVIVGDSTKAGSSGESTSATPCCSCPAGQAIFVTLYSQEPT